MFVTFKFLIPVVMFMTPLEQIPLICFFMFCCDILFHLQGSVFNTLLTSVLKMLHVFNLM